MAAVGVGRRAPSSALVLFALYLSVVGCAVPVATGLDEADANRIVLALDKSGVDSSKDVDPATEGKFRVTVARDDAAHALAAMREEELPRPRARGLLDGVDKSALVPSQSMEHAQLVAGMAGELQRTLEGVDGVLAARVHLNVAAPEPLRDGPRPKATASVLLEHRGATPPLATDAVQRLVAGGVPGLAPADVAVVTLPRAARPAPRESALAHVGPIAVARGSMRPLQAGLAGLVVLVAALAAVCLALYTRLTKLRLETAQANKK
jgi:type III secretion protein J